MEIENLNPEIGEYVGYFAIPDRCKTKYVWYYGLTINAEEMLIVWHYKTKHIGSIFNYKSISDFIEPPEETLEIMDMTKKYKRMKEE